MTDGGPVGGGGVRILRLCFFLPMDLDSRPSFTTFQATKACDPACEAGVF